ncbi:thiamine phosphate synthase [Paenibacillus sp. 2KB_20]
MSKINNKYLLIGGITVERVEEVMGAGADGVAVISAVTEAESTREAVEAFIGKICRVTERIS